MGDIALQEQSGIPGALGQTSSSHGFGQTSTSGFTGDRVAPAIIYQERLDFKRQTAILEFGLQDLDSGMADEGGYGSGPRMAGRSNTRNSSFYGAGGSIPKTSLYDVRPMAKTDDSYSS